MPKSVKPLSNQSLPYKAAGPKTRASSGELYWAYHRSFHLSIFIGESWQRKMALWASRSELLMQRRSSHHGRRISMVALPLLILKAQPNIIETCSNFRGKINTMNRRCEDALSEEIMSLTLLEVEGHSKWRWTIQASFPPPSGASWAIEPIGFDSCLREA